MGFSGGGSNITKSHTHDSNIAQDGGSLAANATQFGLSNGSLLYSDGTNIQELSLGSASDVLEVNGAATAPAWVTPAAVASTWTELINIYNASDIDTGFIDMKTYRWLDIWVSANIPTGGGTAAPLMQWYDPDGNIAAGSHYTSAGFFNSTFYQTGSGPDIPLTFDQTITADRPLFFNMKVTCSPVGLPAGGASMFSWMFSHRIAPNASYASGAGICIDGFTDSALQFCNGFTLSEGNTYDDVLISVYGAGDNTT